MTIPGDWELLEQFVQSGRQDAFAELVRRHVDTIYATALRSLGGPAQEAEDVTQAVFLLLWQKASKVPRQGALAGWLFRATRYCCRNIRKAQGRRRTHEREAAMERPEALSPPAPEEESQVRVLLDAALERLGEMERQAILVRYLQAKSLTETGEILTVAPRTLEKRLERGLAKLRRIFRQKGLIVPAAAVVGVMAAESAKAAPASLVISAANPAIASGMSATGIAKGAAIMMTWMKVQIAAAVIGAISLPVAAILLITAAYGQAPATAAAKLPFTLAKDTTGITEPLHADGTPDYVKALNDRYSQGVTPENNAFVAWLKVVGAGDNVMSPKSREQVLDMCGAGRPEAMKWVDYGKILEQHGILGDAANDFYDGETKVGRQLWTPADYPFLADYLKENEPVFDAVKEAFARPRYWLPYVGSDRLIFVLLPSLGKMRTMSDALSARATLRARNGDFDGFLSDVLAVKHMARHVGSGAAVIERLVGVAIDCKADRVVGAAGGAGILSAAQCEQLKKNLAALEPLPALGESWDISERWTMLDIAIPLAMGDPEQMRFLASLTQDESPGQIAGTGQEEAAKDEKSLLTRIERNAVDWDVVLKRINQVADERVEATKKPLIEDLRKAGEAMMKEFQAGVSGINGSPNGFARGADETREAYTRRVADGILGRVGASMGRSEEMYREALMQDAMVRAVLAAAKYHAEKNQWPGALSDLVPAYLKEVPKDIYCRGGEGEVQYVVAPEGVRIYSIGRNGVDDGGVRDAATKRDDIAIGVQAK